MNTKEVLLLASKHLTKLSGHIFDLLDLTKPISPEAALNLAKIISKLSPLLGNLIEFNLVEFLNDKEEFHTFGKWRRQDPGFPDAIFEGTVHPTPGFEIKAWYPMATEITARFKDSQNHFESDKTHVVLLAWIPSHLIYGKPYILDVCVVPGLSVAAARDNHYHNPPDYLVLEPEDTQLRTRNLQQTNTNGYKWQGTPELLLEAEEVVSSWGPNGKKYLPNREYQVQLRELLTKYPYRLDTNFAKIDRIAHPDIEKFKMKVLETKVKGKTLKQWSRIFASSDDNAVTQAIRDFLKIKEEDTGSLVE